MMYEIPVERSYKSNLIKLTRSAEVAKRQEVQLEIQDAGNLFDFFACSGPVRLHFGSNNVPSPHSTFFSLHVQVKVFDFLACPRRFSQELQTGIDAWIMRSSGLEFALQD